MTDPSPPTPPESASPESHGAGHQPDQIKVAGLVRIGLGLAAIVLVAMGGMVLLFRGLEAINRSELPEYAAEPQPLMPPPPRLDPAQSAQLRQLRAQHKQVLSTYAWVDKQAGVARIPIERAMKMLAAELPVRQEAVVEKTNGEQEEEPQPPRKQSEEPNP